MVWTDAMRAKAAATRAETKRKKEERLARKLERDKKSSDSKVFTIDPDRDTPPDEVIEIADGKIVSHEVIAFDWEEAPLAQCITKAADMKREYERVAAIIVKRQNPTRNQWTCWTYENKDNPAVVIPASVRKQCLKRGDDGRWKFRDDGRFVVESGVRTLRPAFCCNNFCYMLYQSYRVRQKLEQRA
jgi:hypothetical protein